MDASRRLSPGRLRRLREELEEEQLGILGHSAAPELLVDEIDYALRPPRHERRLPTYGAIVTPSHPTERWKDATGLDLTLSPTARRADAEVRRYADGEVSWAVRDADGVSALAVFDRAASSERDVVILAEATGAAVVQRCHDGVVRVAGPFGVARWDGTGWHLEPPIGQWLGQTVLTHGTPRQCEVLDQLFAFAVHDLGASGIGALLVLGDVGTASIEDHLPDPPPLRLDRPEALGPLRHVLAQTDGAAVFDADGVLRRLGARLIPSPAAERATEVVGGTRHISGKRFSYDAPAATVVVVSDDGPVTAFRGGAMVGRSPADT